MPVIFQTHSIPTPFVPPPIITTPTPLPNATQGTAYSTTLAAFGGIPPYTWMLLSDINAIYVAVMTAAVSGLVAGYSSGLSLGSISPSTDKNGNTIDRLDTSSGGITLNFAIDSASSLGMSYFTTLNVGALAFASASSVFQFNAGVNLWQWSTGAPVFVSGSQYSAVLS